LQLFRPSDKAENLNFIVFAVMKASSSAVQTIVLVMPWIGA